MKKRIAIISANIYHIPYPVYPLGVSYLASYLSEHLPDDYEVKLFDFNLGDYESFALFLKENNFDFVGISLRNFDDSTNHYEENIFIAHYKKVMEIARANTDAPIVLGGSGFGVFPELIFNELKPDYGIKGEGESSLKEMIVALTQGHDPRAIEGVAYRDADGSFHINGHTKYISAPILHVESEWAEYYWKNSGMLNIQTKRGCPYKCIFCSYPLIDGRKVRMLDAEMVVNNIKEIYYSKGISYLFFTDSIFNIHKEYNEELARRIIESKVQIQWGAYFSPSNLSIKELELYKQSGLTHIEFGTDSLSDRQLENYKKNFRFSDIKEQSQNCGNLGIFYAHFLILGGYGETNETLGETFEHSKELGLTIYFPYLGMRVYPETELCDIAIREGLIRSANDLINPVYYISKEIDKDAIKAQAKATGQPWVFPDDEPPPIMERIRGRGKKGPLWEYLRFNY